MNTLAVIGTLVTLLGLLGLLICIRRASGIASEEDADAARDKLNTIVAWNMASLGIAGIGLSMVVLSLFL